MWAFVLKVASKLVYLNFIFLCLNRTLHNPLTCLFSKAQISDWDNFAMLQAFMAFPASEKNWKVRDLLYKIILDGIADVGILKSALIQNARIFISGFLCCVFKGPTTKIDVLEHICSLKSSIPM